MNDTFFLWDIVLKKEKLLNTYFKNMVYNITYTLKEGKDASTNS